MASDETTIEQIATDSSETSSQEAVTNPLLEELKATASNPALTEDLALRLLKRNDLPAEILERISKNGTIAKSRKVRLSLVEHPRTPRHLSVPMLRHLFTFDLMQVALAPIVPRGRQAGRGRVTHSPIGDRFHRGEDHLGKTGFGTHFTRIVI